MKLEQAHIDQIRTAFEKMQSKKDLLDLLNEAKSFVYGEKAVPFELKQLTWMLIQILQRRGTLNSKYTRNPVIIDIYMHL